MTNITYQDAYNELTNKVYMPVFFTKLSQDYGFTPDSQDEARKVLEIAGKLREAEAQENTKSASTRSSLLSSASQDLDKVLGKSTSWNDSAIQKTAAEIAKNKDMRDVALVYQDYLAQLLASR